MYRKALYFAQQAVLMLPGSCTCGHNSFKPGKGYTSLCHRITTCMSPSHRSSGQILVRKGYLRKYSVTRLSTSC